MAERMVTDAAGRTWTCASEDTPDAMGVRQGQDVQLTCVTPSVDSSVNLTVGWQWERMAPNGLASLIAKVSPVPRR